MSYKQRDTTQPTYNHSTTFVLKKSLTLAVGGALLVLALPGLTSWHWQSVGEQALYTLMALFGLGLLNHSLHWREGIRSLLSAVVERPEVKRLATELEDERSRAEALHDELLRTRQSHAGAIGGRTKNQLTADVLDAELRQVEVVAFELIQRIAQHKPISRRPCLHRYGWSRGQYDRGIALLRHLHLIDERSQATGVPSGDALRLLALELNETRRLRDDSPVFKPSWWFVNS